MDEKPEEKKDKEAKEETTTDLGEPKNLFDLVYRTKNVYETRPTITKHLKTLIDKSPLKDEYSFLFLWDDAGQINRYTANQIYSALSGSKHNNKKNILLILYILGGLIEPAYLISKCCKEYSKEKFVVAIPRQAKSAATLLALGSDEIHMGLISELGPIDPQIGRYPALGLGDAVKYVASLCKTYPESSDMFAKYLSLSLDLHHLGYLERVAQSAVQYAEHLLENKQLPAGKTAIEVAHRLVYWYKAHGFVIDRKEAESLLGENLVKYETEEYKLADSLHKFLEWAALAFKVLKKIDFKIIGDSNSGINLIPTEEE
jgi:membrane-bound ClpP family serine protease